MRRNRYQIIFSIIIVVAIFSPAIFAEVCGIDDMTMLHDYQERTSWSLKGIFLPGFSHGLYYRPLIEVSFLIDKYFLKLNTAFMHIENIFFHVANTILVFLIVRQLIHFQRKKKNIYLPLITALFFGMHPIVTEPVNWISGRFDLMAGTFILLSALLLIKYKETYDSKYFVLSAVSFLFGLMSKESAAAFLAGYYFIFIAQSVGHQEEDVLAASSQKDRDNNLRVLLVGIFVVLVFFLLRTHAFTSNYSRIGMTLRFIFNDISDTTFFTLRTFSFYIKKIFLPYPLNFAIMKVDPLYEILSVPLIMLCVYIAIRKNLISAIFTTGVLLISPSFVLAFNQIAWTPYAERYIYLPSAFIIIAVALFLNERVNISNSFVKKAFIAVLLVIMTGITVQRNFIWQKPLALYKDTVEKSPESRDMRIIYGSVLADKGDYQNALIQLRYAGTIPGFGYDERPDLIIASIMKEQGRIEDSIKKNEYVLEKSKGISIAALDNLIELLKRPTKNGRGAEVYALNKKLSEYKLKLLLFNRHPYLLYNLGIISLSFNEKDKALEYFRQADNDLLDGDAKKIDVRKKIEKLTCER